MNKGLYVLLLIMMLAVLLVAGYLVYRFQANGNAIAVDPPVVSVTNPPVIADNVLATPTPIPTIALLTPAEAAPTKIIGAIESDVAAPVVETAPTLTLVSLVPSEMVLIPADVFLLGSDEAETKDGPVQINELPAFAMDRFEVTNADFAAFVESTGYVTYAENSDSQGWRQYSSGRPNHPVVKVTWNDAVAYCTWANKRLPTEFEWEAAARGVDGRFYPWGDQFNGTRANVKDTGLRRTTVVGSFSEGGSPYGIQDMGGNVWEWTASWFQPYPGNDTPSPYFGERFRVTRGGAWFEEAAQVTTFNRNAADPTITANDDVGFRCAKDVE